MSDQYPPQPRWTPQGPYRPTQPQSPYIPPQPVYLPPKKRSNVTALVVLAVGGLFALFLGVVGVVNSPGFKQGFQAGIEATPAPHVSVSASAIPVPSVVAVPTVTVTAPAPAPTVSSNIKKLQATWQILAPADQKDIRDTWAKYKDSPTYSAIYVDTFMDTFKDKLPTLTRAEVIEFLNWTLTN